jgi:hypothetical protein
VKTWYAADSCESLMKMKLQTAIVNVGSVENASNASTWRSNVTMSSSSGNKSKACHAIAGCLWSTKPPFCDGFPTPPENVINGSRHHGVHFRFNWLHNGMSKRGMQFRREGSSECRGRFGKTWPTRGVMYRNVVWKTGGVQIEGGHHLVSRNTILDTGPTVALPLHGVNKEPMLDYEGRDWSVIFDIIHDDGSLNLTGTCSCHAGT